MAALAQRNKQGCQSRRLQGNACTPFQEHAACSGSFTLSTLGVEAPGKQGVSPNPGVQQRGSQQSCSTEGKQGMIDFFQKCKFPFRLAPFYSVNICGKSMFSFVKLVEEEGRNRRDRIAWKGLLQCCQLSSNYELMRLDVFLENP